MSIKQTFYKFIGREVNLKDDGTLDLSTEEQTKLTALGKDADNVISAVTEELKSEVDSLDLLKSELEAEKQKNEDANKKIKETQELNELLSNLPEQGGSTQVRSSNDPKVKTNMSKDHLFGIAHEHYSLDKFWNKAAKERMFPKSKSRTQEESLKTELDKYGEELGVVYGQLKKQGSLSELFKAKGKDNLEGFTQKFISNLEATGDFDYSDLDTQFGAYYYTRRMLDLISYIRNIKDISTIFPYHSGVQDGETVVALFHGRSNSQAFQSGNVFSGTETFEGDVARVKAVMFSKIFEDMEKLETSYIGYLNRDGSDPRKLSFIEYIMDFMMKIIVKEDNHRNVVGVRVEPTASSSSYFTFASDGVLTTKERYVEENRCFVSSVLNKYTAATIYDDFKAFAVEFKKFTGLEDLSGYGLYFNSNDAIDFLDAFGDKFSKDANYDGDFLILKNMWDLRLIPVPHMGSRQDVFIAPLGTFEILMDRPGEEFGFYTDNELEITKIKSRFKRGTSCWMPGRKHSTYAALLADTPDNVTIAVNRPYLELAADVATPNASTDWYFRTIANAAATVITDVLNAMQGRLYRIEIGSLTNASTISKAAKFANITAAFTPTAVGDYIELIYDPINDLFYEYARKVGGTYAKNAALVAPVYTD